MTRFFHKFGRWFASPLGIMETVTIVGLWVIAWIANPHLDEHLFGLLVVLTVYSAVTQPVLAFIAYSAGEKTERVLEQLTTGEAHLEHLALQNTRILEHLESLIEAAP